MRSDENILKNKRMVRINILKKWVSWITYINFKVVTNKSQRQIISFIVNITKYIYFRVKMRCHSHVHYITVLRRIIKWHGIEHFQKIGRLRGGRIPFILEPCPRRWTSAKLLGWIGLLKRSRLLRWEKMMSQTQLLKLGSPLLWLGPLLILLRRSRK